MSEAEQLNPDKTSKLRKWGIACLVIGLVLEVSVLLFQILRVSNVGGIKELAFMVGFFIGTPLCGVGLALIARAKGQSSLVCVFTLVPILGPFFGLLCIIFVEKLFHENRRRTASFVFSILALGGVAVLAAIAIPNFMTYGARARQSEAKVNLGGIFTSATAYKKEFKTFEVSDIGQLGFSLSGAAYRYSFWYSVNGVPTMFPHGSEIKSPCDVTTPPTSIRVAASVTGFTAMAKGSLDNDATCDEWYINDARVLVNTINDIAK